MPKVSVIIPTYNSAKYIGDAIDSVLEQTYQDFEVIIVDDGSIDNVRDIVESYRKKFPQKFQYIYQKNQGLAIARNTGIEHAQGEYIALLDADDIWRPHRLVEGINILDDHPDVGLVHANIERINEHGDYLYTPKRDAKRLSGYIFNALLLRRVHIACPTVLFRKFCCERVGMFDEKLTRLGCEDRDLWLRIASVYKIAYIDKVLAKYRMHEESMSHNTDSMFKARCYVADKFYVEYKMPNIMKRLMLANIYREMADESLLEHKFKTAQNNYVKALRSWPFSFWSWVNFMKAMLKLNVHYR